MIRSIFGQLGWMVILNLLTKPLWILAENTVQDKLGHEDFGRFSALFALAYIFAPLIDLGTNPYLTRSVASKPELYPHLIGRIFTLKIVLSFGYLLTIVILGGVWVASTPQEWMLLLICAAIHIGISFILLFRSVFQAFQAFGWDGIASVIDKLTFLFVLAFLFSLPVFNISIYSLSFLGVTSFSSLLLGWLVVRKYGLVSLRFRKEDLIASARLGLSFALLFVLSSFNERIGQVLLLIFAGDEASGLYAGAFRWYGAFSMFLWTVLPVFFAKFAQVVNVNTDDSQRLFRIGMFVVGVPMLWVSGFVFIFTDKLFFLFDHSSGVEIERMSVVLKILAVALALNGLFNIFSTWLTAVGFEKIVNRLLIIAAIITLVSNVILIPIYHEIAPAIVLSCTFVILSIGYVRGFSSKSDFSVPWISMIYVIVSAVFGMALIYIFQNLGFVWWVSAGFSGFFTCVLSGLFYTFGWKN